MRIFVYGTLKRGKENHAILAGQRFVTEARTSPAFRLFDLGGYPGMVEHVPHGLSIHGEIWDVDAATLQRLDLLEDVDGGEYVRKPIPLQPPHEHLDAQAYIYLLPVTACPDCGDCW